MTDKYDAQKRYQKAKMSEVRAKYKSEFVDEFKAACETLELKHSDVIREAMILTIEKAKNGHKK